MTLPSEFTGVAESPMVQAGHTFYANTAADYLATWTPVISDRS